MSREPGKPLRQGFTTGSAAAAAAKAALLLLVKGEAVETVDIPLPGEQGGRLMVPVESVTLDGPTARAVVVKDAGDDPDATHRARIACVAEIEPPAGREDWAPPRPGRALPCTRQRDVRPFGIPYGGAGPDEEGRQHERAGARGRAGIGEPEPEEGAPTPLSSGTSAVEVVIEGGSGVGRVTLPGLPVPVGRAAINPAPMEQIERAAREAQEGTGVAGLVRLVVEVEDGEAIARHTLNPRLGIVGGISILGTQGIVKPFSHDAWKATIDSGLAVAREAGMTAVGFSTGRRSERMLMAHRPDLPELAFTQAADFFAHALSQAARMGFQEIVWGCFFGKLAKMAQGLAYTHARTEPTDMAMLAGLAREAGADSETCALVTGANTARHALEIVPDGALRQRFTALAAGKALEAARSYAGSGPRIVIVCFGFESGILAEAAEG